MAREYQQIQLRGSNSEMRGILRIIDEKRGVRESSLIFDEAKSVSIDLPMGDNIDIVDIDNENDAIYLKVFSEDKLPEVCIVDDKTGATWCNYEIFKSGKDPNEVRQIVNALADAIDLLKHAHPSIEDTLKHVVARFKITDKIEYDSLSGDELPAYATYPSDAPVCEVTISSKWLKEGDVKLAARIISHELGHCQEAYHRRIRYLPPRHGGWVQKGEKVVPKGEERVAEHFSKRVMKSIDINQ